MKLPLASLLALAPLGCVGSAQSPVWSAPTIERWALSERTYGAIAETWASALDGTIPPGETALLFEPVFRIEASGRKPTSPPDHEACLHGIQVRYDGPKSQGVGSVVSAELEVPGPGDSAHLIGIRGSHDEVRILDLRGAEFLSGERSRFLLSPGGRAVLRFTSLAAGTGGLELRVLGEVPASGGDTSKRVAQLNR